MSKVALGTTMDAIATALSSLISGTAHAWPVEDARPGDAVVGYPDGAITFASTFGRGGDELTIPVWLICGYRSQKSTRDAIAAHLTGGSSVVDALLALSTDPVVSLTGTVEPFTTPQGEPLVAVRFDLTITT